MRVSRTLLWFKGGLTLVLVVELGLEFLTPLSGFTLIVYYKPSFAFLNCNLDRLHNVNEHLILIYLLFNQYSKRGQFGNVITDLTF